MLYLTPISQNWQWDGKNEESNTNKEKAERSQIPERPRIREAASIHVRAGDNSTVSYTMPFVASPTGYDPILEVHLDTVTVTSSLNDIRLITAESCRVSRILCKSHSLSSLMRFQVQAQMPTPLAWNAERTWKYEITLRQPVIFLLRDHVNMFTDLGKDWSSGPPSDYNRFIPMQYHLDIKLHNYELNTYLNDQNIIDKPLIREQNSMFLFFHHVYSFSCFIALLTLRGALLHNGVKIPLAQYRPIANTVSFWIGAPNIDVFMTLPRWNSHSLFPSPHRSYIGHVGHFYLDSSYRYFAEVSPENIDNLKLNFVVSFLKYASVYSHIPDHPSAETWCTKRAAIPSDIL